MLDFVAPALLLAQVIGRWGNFFNQEAHGAATTLEHLQSLHIPDFIIEGMNIGGVYYEPTFLYESLWCLLGFIIITETIWATLNPPSIKESVRIISIKNRPKPYHIK